MNTGFSLRREITFCKNVNFSWKRLNKWSCENSRDTWRKLPNSFCLVFQAEFSARKKDSKNNLLILQCTSVNSCTRLWCKTFTKPYNLNFTWNRNIISENSVTNWYSIFNNLSQKLFCYDSVYTVIKILISFETAKVILEMQLLKTALQTNLQ